MGELETGREVDLGRVWTGVATRVWARPPGRVERGAARVLRSPALARALVTTPSLVWSWLLANGVVFLVGGVLDRTVQLPVVALVAPVIAGAGIAYAYGPGTDPAYELARTTAVSAPLVLLVRAVTVFAVDAGLGLAASAVLPAAHGLIFGWLAPMAAVSAVALAVATLARSAAVGAAFAGVLWCALVLAGQVVSGEFAAAVVATELIMPYLAVTAAGIAVTALFTSYAPPQERRRT